MSSALGNPCLLYSQVMGTRFCQSPIHSASSAKNWEVLVWSMFFELGISYARHRFTRGVGEAQENMQDPE